MKSVLQMVLRSLLMISAIGSPAFGAEYIVKYRNAQNVANFENVLALDGARTGTQLVDYHPAGQLLTVDIQEAKKVQSLIGLLSDPNVEYIVPNIQLHSFVVPMSASPIDDAAQKQQWAIEKVAAQKAWTRAGNKGSKKVIVAVIDTGTDYKHKNLAPNMVKGFNFINNNDDAMDIVGQNPGHGTHCAGIIGATGLIEGGTVGISPEVSIMPIRFLDENGSGDLNNGVKAIDYAVEKKVDVISASWGAAVPRTQAQPLIEAIARAEKAGIIFVVAASNDGRNNDSYEVYPANAGNSNTISVAASNSGDTKPSWSNYGRAKVMLASPGDSIVSTLPGDKFGSLSGTSMATPLVAGLVALVKAQDSSLNAMQIRSLLQATGEKVGIETACDCRVNAFNAVDAVLSKKMFVSPFAGTIAKGDKMKFEAVYGKAPFTFTSSNAATASIDANGELTALADGDTSITVKDAAGTTASSYKIFVGAKSSQPSDPGGEQPGAPGAPGAPGECPIGNPELCQVLCQLQPDLPFCKQ